MDTLVETLYRQLKDSVGNAKALEILAEASASSRDATGLRFLSDVYKQQLAEAQKQMEKIPINGDGWMSVAEITNLGLGFSDLTLRKKLNNNGYFQSRTRHKLQGKGKAPVEYRITMDNIGIIDKEGKTESWRDAFTLEKLANTHINRIALTLMEIGDAGDVDKIRQLESSLAAPSSIEISGMGLDVEEKNIPIHINRTGNSYTVNTAKEYDKKFFTEMMHQIDNDVFNKPNIEDLWLKLCNDAGSKTSLKGSYITGMLAKISKGILLGNDSYKALARIVGVNFYDIEKQLNPIEGQLKSYVHYIGNRSIPYILKADVPAIAKKLQENIYGEAYTKVTIDDITAAGNNGDIKDLERKLQQALQRAEAAEKQIASGGIRGYHGPAVSRQDTNLKKSGNSKQRKEREKSKISIRIGSASKDFYPGDSYNKNDVDMILKLIHPQAFGNYGADKIIEKLGADDKIKGENLIDFINNVNHGIMLLSSSSVKRTLENELSMDYSEIEEAFKHPECQEYVHKMDGIIREEYLFKDELIALKSVMNELMGGKRQATSYRRTEQTIEDTKPADISNTTGTETGQDQWDKELHAEVHKWKTKLREKGIMPYGTIYDKLLNNNILDESTVKGVKSSYSKFQEAMEGFRFMDFNRLRTNMPNQPMWEDFKKHINPAIEMGLVREIAEYLKVDSSQQFYVVAEGKREDLENFLGVKK